jgi:acyl carrier protein
VAVPNALVVKVRSMAEQIIGYDVDIDVPLDDQGFDSFDLVNLEIDLECEYNLDNVEISDTCTILTISGKLT